MEDQTSDSGSGDGMFLHRYEIQHEKALLASAARAIEAWDICVSEISVVSHSENIVFRVDSDSGQAFVFRFHRPGYHSLRELHGELEWTAGLNQSGIGAPVPRHTRDNSAFASVYLPELSQTQICKSRRVGRGDGDGNADSSGKTDKSNLVNKFHKTGQLAAQIHNQAVALGSACRI